jgi:hypothetical protein
MNVWQRRLAVLRELGSDALLRTLHRRPVTPTGRDFIIVTGAGRSGTSAVARVLHESGLSMGNRLAAATEANQEGFYEDLDVVDLNERVLAALGMTDPWRRERWPLRAGVAVIGRAFQQEMAELALAARAGWKDPRFSITLEAWLPALPFRPRLVVCLRSPEAYAHSVTQIFGIVSRERAMREWARHYRRLLDVIRDYRLDATCVEYDALVEEPAATVQALSAFAGVPLEPRYVERRLRRQRAPVPERYRHLYDRVLQLSPVQRTIVERIDEEPRERIVSEDYLSSTDAIWSRLEIARESWLERVRLPEPSFDSETSGASAEYASFLAHTQEQIGALVPPAELDRFHEVVTRQINIERMLAELVRSACNGAPGSSRNAALRAWKKFASGRARIQADRERRQARG